MIEALLNDIRSMGLEVRHDPASKTLLLEYKKNSARLLTHEVFTAPVFGQSPAPNVEAHDSKIDGHLLISSFISESAGIHLSAQGWSWADAAGNWDIRAESLFLQRRNQSSAPKLAVQLVLPATGRDLALIRRLIRPIEKISPSILAKQVQASQSRVSRVLKLLVEMKLASHSSHGNWEIDRKALLEKFLLDYRGPNGSSSYYLTEMPIEETANELAERLPSDSWCFSGEVAAALVSPQGFPIKLMLYGPEFHSIVGPRWKQVKGFAEGNICMTTPQDSSVYSGAFQLPSSEAGTLVRLADPTQIAWDLLQVGSEESLAQAEGIKEWLLKTPQTN